MSIASVAVSHRGLSSGLSDAEEEVATFKKYSSRDHKQAIEPCR
jgi:hypothetical protein